MATNLKFFVAIGNYNDQISRAANPPKYSPGLSLHIHRNGPNMPFSYLICNPISTLPHSHFSPAGTTFAMPLSLLGSPSGLASLMDAAQMATGAVPLNGSLLVPTMKNAVDTQDGPFSVKIFLGNILKGWAKANTAQ